MRNPILFILAIPLFVCCSKQHQLEESAQLISMQFIDRNGITETISTKAQLNSYQQVDFCSPQSYQKVLRVFERDRENKSHAVITSYHPNGLIYQYLEVVEGRANGTYKEWHLNGTLRMELNVIEGLADLTDKAQASWIFHGKCAIWDENRHLNAEFNYEKGSLQGDSKYYFPNGNLKKIVPYKNHEIDGVVQIFDQQGTLIEQMEYVQGLQHCESFAFWEPQKYRYREKYQGGILQSAVYYDPDGKFVSEITYGKGKRAHYEDKNLHSLTEYQKGIPDGKIQIYYPNGSLDYQYTIKDGQKTGEEWEYYPPSKKMKQTPKPKLYILWDQDMIRQTKTWYENGVIESEQHLHNNKKHGMCCAWYEDGGVMLIEEYENNLLTSGSYYKKGNKQYVSKVEGGNGIATLYDRNGHFLRKITYEKGHPIIESIP